MARYSMDDRTVVVFGCTGGLGGAVVARFEGSGATVVAGDARLPGAAHRLDRVEYRQVDALDEQSVSSFFASVKPAPWAVVNLIGGFTPGQAVADMDLSILRRQLELNVVTAATVTKHAIGAISSGGRGGRIVHTSSRVATQDGHGGFSYSVSKLGVVRLVEAAAEEVKELGITVNCIMPSIIDTPANREAMPNADHSRWPRPEQIASVLVFLVSEDSELISGAAIPVYGRA